MPPTHHVQKLTRTSLPGHLKYSVPPPPRKVSQRSHCHSNAYTEGGLQVTLHPMRWLIQYAGAAHLTTLWEFITINAVLSHKGVLTNFKSNSGASLHVDLATMHTSTSDYS